MQIDPTQHSHADNYKILTSVVVPRPIAWVTSLGQTGVVNLAPFSIIKHTFIKHLKKQLKYIWMRFFDFIQ